MDEDGWMDGWIVGSQDNPSSSSSSKKKKNQYCADIPDRTNFSDDE